MITPETDSELKVLEDRFNQIDYAALQRFCTDGQPESLQLDFKQANPQGKLTKDDRDNLAEAISGFSNTSGGIIIWGVSTTRDGEIELASSIKEFDNVNAFISSLEDRTHQAHFPHNVYIKHEAIRESEDSTNGCAKTLIGVRLSDPVRAEFGGKRYLIRSGSSFVETSHDHLREMFGSRRSPVLDVVVSGINRRRNDPATDCHIFSINLALRNVGRFSAVAPMVAITHDWFQGLNITAQDNRIFKLVRPNRPKTSYLISDSAGILHPGTEYPLADIECYVPNKWSRIPVGKRVHVFTIDGAQIQADKVRLTCEISSYDTPIKQFELPISLDDLYNHIP